LRDVDIRALNAGKLSITERDAAMAAKIMEVSGDTDSVVVIVGEAHRAGVVQRLKDKDMSAESICFPE
jgi:pheromone shutdown protein TraB